MARLSRACTPPVAPPLASVQMAMSAGSQSRTVSFQADELAATPRSPHLRKYWSLAYEAPLSPFIQTFRNRCYLPLIPMQNRIQRFTWSRFEVGALCISEGDQCRLSDLFVRNAQHTCRLLLKHKVQC